MDSNIKQELQENMTHYEHELSSEMLKLGNRSREFVANALIIGGSVAAVYLLYRQLTGKKKSGLLNTVMLTLVSSLVTEKGKDLLMAGKASLTEFLAKEK